MDKGLRRRPAVDRVHLVDLQRVDPDVDHGNSPLMPAAPVLRISTPARFCGMGSWTRTPKPGTDGKKADHTSARWDHGITSLNIGLTFDLCNHTAIASWQRRLARTVAGTEFWCPHAPLSKSEEVSRQPLRMRPFPIRPCVPGIRPTIRGN